MVFAQKFEMARLTFALSVSNWPKVLSISRSTMRETSASTTSEYSRKMRVARAMSRALDSVLTALIRDAPAAGISRWGSSSCLYLRFDSSLTLTSPMYH